MYGSCFITGKLINILFIDDTEVQKIRKLNKDSKRCLNKSYGNFFFLLTKKEKRTLLKEMPFMLALAAFKAIWEIFPSSREGFTRKFAIKVAKL